MNVSAETDRAGYARRIRRILKISLLTFLLLVAALAGFWELMIVNAARERAAWKGPALERLAGLSIADDEIRRKFDVLRTDPPNNNTY